jgi:hypothetical protein
LRLPTEDKPFPLSTLIVDLLWCEGRINAWVAKLRDFARRFELARHRFPARLPPVGCPQVYAAK